jgi:hypothetical protein
LVNSQAFIQQRIRHDYRRQRAASLPSSRRRTVTNRSSGVDGLDVAHAVEYACERSSLIIHRITLPPARIQDEGDCRINGGFDLGIG